MRTELDLAGATLNRPAPARSYAPSRRDGSVSFEAPRHLDRSRHAFEARAWGDAIFPPLGPQFRGLSDLAEDQLYRAVNECRQVWQREVIERTADFVDYPFLHRVDLSAGEDRRHLDAVGLRLARAGRDLFDSIFNTGDDGLREIGRRLDDGSRERSLVLTLHSEVCFVPWGLLYTPPDRDTDLWEDDAPWSMEGFWGYRHDLEQHLWHRPQMEEAIEPEEGVLRFGCNVDRRIDEQERFPLIRPVLDFLARYESVAVELRTEKSELGRALRRSKRADDVLYFGCHARVVGNPEEEVAAAPRLTLSDDEHVTDLDFRRWLDTRTTPYSPPPVVFLNACQGGQLESSFYGAFGKELLRHARCLVGAQIDLPVIFAADYAQEFFARLFAGQRRIGDIRRELARHYADACRNPLGLVYSLYYGLDAHLTEEIR